MGLERGGQGQDLGLGAGFGCEVCVKGAAHEVRTLRRESAARARREAGGLRSPHSAHLRGGRVSASARGRVGVRGRLGAPGGVEPERLGLAS